MVENQGFGPNDEMEDVTEGLPPHTGAILAWQGSDQLGLTGILYVILALILVNGRAILESEFLGTSFVVQLSRSFMIR